MTTTLPVASCPVPKKMARAPSVLACTTKPPKNKLESTEAQVSHRSAEWILVAAIVGNQPFAL